MKILQVCNKPPYPPYDGGSIAMNNITDGLLKEGHEIKLVSVITDKHSVNLDDLPSKYKKETNIELVYLNTRINPIKALVNLIFTKRSYNIARFENVLMEEKLLSVLNKERFDVVIIESLFLNFYVDLIRLHSKAKIILRAHNVEFVIWERLAQEETNIFKKKYLSILSHRLRKEEIRALNKFDGIITVSNNDRDLFNHLGCKKPIETIPIALDITKNINGDYKLDHPSLFFIGAMDWRPNQEGLQWFLDNVWSSLNDTFPKLIFHIAGRGEANWLYPEKYKNIVFHGEVDDAAKFFKTKSIMLVPLFSGSGMRVKIIEAMTFGKAIVSTTIGAEGIDCENRNNILLANTETEFINAIKNLIENNELYDSIRRNARQFSQEKYSNTVITKNMMKFIDEI